MLNKAFRGIVNCHNIVHRVRAYSSQDGTQQNQRHAPQQQKILAVAPRSIHLELVSRLLSGVCLRSTCLFPSPCPYGICAMGSSSTGVRLPSFTA